MATKNDITNDSLITKAPTDAYRNNYDAIFKKPKQPHVPEIKKLVHDACFECDSIPHKLDCSSKAVFDAYILLRDTDKWKYFTESMLNTLEFKVWTEQQDRKYSNMFDNEDSFTPITAKAFQQSCDESWKKAGLTGYVIEEKNK